MIEFLLKRATKIKLKPKRGGKMRKMGLVLILFLSFHTFANSIPMPILAEHSRIYLCIKDGDIVSTDYWFRKYKKICKLPFKFDSNKRFDTQFNVFTWKVNKKELYVVFKVFNDNLDYVFLFEYEKNALKLKKAFKGKNVIDWHRKGRVMTIEDKLKNLKYKMKLPAYFVKGLVENPESVLCQVKSGQILNEMRVKGIYYGNYVVFIRKHLISHIITDFLVFDANKEKLITLKFNYNCPMEKVEMIPVNDSEFLLFAGVGYQSLSSAWVLNGKDNVDSKVYFWDIFYIFLKTGRIVKVPIERSDYPHCLVIDGKATSFSHKKMWVEPMGFSALEHVQKLSDRQIALYFRGISKKGGCSNITLIYDINDLRNAAKFYLNPIEIKEIKETKAKRE